MLNPCPDASANCRKMASVMVRLDQFGSTLPGPPLEIAAGLLQRLPGAPKLTIGIFKARQRRRNSWFSAINASLVLC